MKILQSKNWFKFVRYDTGSYTDFSVALYELMIECLRQVATSRAT